MSEKQSPHRGIPQQPIRIRVGLYQTPSWREVGRSYQQNLDARTCTCWAFTSERSRTQGQPCKHLVNAFLASFFENMERASAVDTEVLTRLLDTHRYDDRPDVRNAILTVLWARSQNLAALPGPEPDDDRVPSGCDAGELHQEFEIERNLEAQREQDLKRMFA
jgi:hypothetical protein